MAGDEDDDRAGASAVGSPVHSYSGEGPSPSRSEEGGQREAVGAGSGRRSTRLASRPRSAVEAATRRRAAVAGESCSPENRKRSRADEAVELQRRAWRETSLQAELLLSGRRRARNLKSPSSRGGASPGNQSEVSASSSESEGASGTRSRSRGIAGPGRAVEPVGAGESEGEDEEGKDEDEDAIDAAEREAAAGSSVLA